MSGGPVVTLDIEPNQDDLDGLAPVTVSVTAHGYSEAERAALDDVSEAAPPVADPVIEAARRAIRTALHYCTCPACEYGRSRARG